MIEFAAPQAKPPQRGADQMPAGDHSGRLAVEDPRGPGTDRAIGQSLLDYPAEDGSPEIAASFADDYATMLRLLARAVRQLADQRSNSQPGQELADASDCKHRLETEAARLPEHSHQRSVAQHLSRLAADVISEARP